MSEQTGEKTEQPTARRLEEAWSKGQFPRSLEVQTIAVMGGGMVALSLFGGEIWRNLALTMTGLLSHLHDITLTQDSLHGYLITAMLVFGKIAAPIACAVLIAGLLAGAIQTRFRISGEALEANWERLDPVEGFKRLFSARQAAPSGIALLKLAAVMALTYGAVLSIMNDPIFSTPVNAARIAQFIAEAAFRIVMRVAGILAVIAAIDFGYQFWRTQQDLMMTRQELMDEVKESEGNQLIKRQRGNRRRQISQRKMMQSVPKADVVVANPVHIAIALQYDRQNMRAPKIVAKGTRLNAQRIKEIAARHQIPVVENRPLARMLLKHGRVGAEIPVQYYSAVAEILAWVYRVNRYRYYAEHNQRAGASDAPETAR